jgi:hypothetical protein
MKLQQESKSREAALNESKKIIEEIIRKFNNESITRKREPSQGGLYLYCAYRSG